jgi:hypothetical protein
MLLPTGDGLAMPVAPVSASDVGCACIASMRPESRAGVTAVIAAAVNEPASRHIRPKHRKARRHVSIVRVEVRHTLPQVPAAMLKAAASPTPTVGVRHAVAPAMTTRPEVPSGKDLGPGKIIATKHLDESGHS